MDMLEQLSRTIESRKDADPETSYVASLHAGGEDAICGKVMEEAEELVEAARTGARNKIVYEAADLWFHSLVLLSRYDLTHDAIVEELRRRFGVSGIEEKKSRGDGGR